MIITSYTYFKSKNHKLIADDSVMQYIHGTSLNSTLLLYETTAIIATTSVIATTTISLRYPCVPALQFTIVYHYLY